MTEMRNESIPEWTLGWRMKRALNYAGIHADDLADELGVSRATVSRWLNDRGPVRKIYLSQIALRCGVPLEWLRGTGTEDGPRVNARYGSENQAFTWDAVA